MSKDFTEGAFNHIQFKKELEPFRTRIGDAAQYYGSSESQY